MSKISDVLHSLPFLRKSKGEDDAAKASKGRDSDENEDEDEEGEEEKQGAISLNEGQHEKIFGIRREVVKGIGAFFGVVLLAALLLAPGESDNKESTGDGFRQASSSDIPEQKGKNTKDASNDYGALIESNRRKAEQESMAARAAQGQQPENGKNANAAPAAPAASSVPPSIPRVTATPTVVPVAQAPQPQAQAQPQPQVTQPKQKDSRYSSAIAFGLSGGETESSTPVVGSGQTAQGDGGTSGGSAGGNAASSQPLSGIVPVSATAMNITPRSLAIGTIIPVRLITGINTDSPGQVIAMVLSDVTDSLTGTQVLIPAGSRLFGTLKGSANGTTGRISLTFPTILTPNNLSYNVGDSFQAMDGAGYSGVKGKVNKHTESRFSSGIMAASIAALGSLAAGNTNGNSNTYSAGQLASQGALASLINQTTSLIQAGASQGPTTTVKPGYEFSVYVTQNIQF